MLTYLLTCYSTVLPEKLTGSQSVNEFQAFYVTRKLITAFRNARHLSLSWARSTQSMAPSSHFLKIHSNIIVPSTPGYSKCFLSLSLHHQNPVYTSPLPHTCYLPRPSHSRAVLRKLKFKSAADWVFLNAAVLMPKIQTTGLVLNISLHNREGSWPVQERPWHLPGRVKVKCCYPLRQNPMAARSKV